MQLDDVDYKIVELLRSDGRMAFGTLGQQVGLSEAATRQRVSRLRQSGVFHIVGVLDPKLMGFGVAAMIGIRANGDIKTLAKEIATIDEVEYVVLCCGNFDLLVEAICENHEALLDVLNDQLRPLDGVRETEVFIYFSIAKVNMAWGQGRLRHLAQH